MKKNIHPKYNKEAQVTCSCGNKFNIGSTEEEIHLDVCSACHPLYTGAHRFVDTAGRVDKFKERMEKAKALRAQKASKKKQNNKQDDKEKNTEEK